ncbi:hypothetical protein [Sphingomonas sp. DT-204]|uniref:hypothetical protein n=1 Tax=Sphingomonas sp. DT-204 TaxID=3396166 RepID=UPI003F1B222A
MLDPAGGSSSVSATQAQQLAPTQSPSRDPQVEQAVQETARFAQEYHGDPAYVIQQTMADPGLSQAQKDEYIARVVDLASGSDPGFRTQMGGLDDRARGELVTAMEQIGVAYTDPATPQLRDQVTAAMGRNIDSGRLNADQIYSLVDPSRNPASDGVRQLLTTATDGAVLQQVAYDLRTDAGRNGYDINTQEGMRGVQALTAAADIAGMAAQHGYVAAANGVIAHIADQPNPGELIQLMDRLPMNAYGNPPSGRGGFDAVASALAGTNNNYAQAKFDKVFSAMVDLSGESSAFDRSAGLNDLGAYFNRHVGRLNQETTWAGGWNDRGEDAKPPTAYHSLTERFMRNVMLNGEFDGRAATQQAVADEMARLGNIVGAGPGAGAPNGAQRADAARQFGTLVGSMQGAAADYVKHTRDSADQQIESIRTITDLLTDQVLGKTGPLGEALGGQLVDSFWDYLGGRAEAGAEDDVNAALGQLNDVGEAIDQAMTQSLRTNYPPETANQTGVDSPLIVSAYEQAVTTHRANPE